MKKADDDSSTEGQRPENIICNPRSESNQIQQFLNGPSIFSVPLRSAHIWPATDDEIIVSEIKLEQRGLQSAYLPGVGYWKRWSVCQGMLTWNLCVVTELMTLPGNGRVDMSNAQ